MKELCDMTLQERREYIENKAIRLDKKTIAINKLYADIDLPENSPAKYEYDKIAIIALIIIGSFFSIVIIALLMIMSSAFPAMDLFNISAAMSSTGESTIVFTTLVTLIASLVSFFAFSSAIVNRDLAFSHTFLIQLICFSF